MTKLLNEPIFDLIKSDNSFNEIVARISTYIRFGGKSQLVCDAVLLATVGKPGCRIELWNNEKQELEYAFPNLYLYSSRLAEDILVRQDYEPIDIYRICWLIEHTETPCDNMVRETVTRYIGIKEFLEYRELMKTKVVNFEPLWNGFDKPKNLLEGKKPKRVYFPIAASASGKSTICETMIANDGEFLKTRYDSLRKELYSENGKYDYWQCIECSINDPKWESKAEEIYLSMLQTGKNILFDNCNVMYNDRKYQIKLAREYGYEVIALTIPIDLATLKYRQDHRRTKLTPWTVSENQYFELQQPCCSIDEFDYIFPLDYR